MVKKLCRKLGINSVLSGLKEVHGVSILEAVEHSFSVNLLLGNLNELLTFSSYLE